MLVAGPVCAAEVGCRCNRLASVRDNFRWTIVERVGEVFRHRVFERFLISRGANSGFRRRETRFVAKPRILFVPPSCSSSSSYLHPHPGTIKALAWLVPVESSVASVCVCFPIVVNEVEARSIPARVVAGAASCDMGEVSARVGDACTAAATLGRRHRRHIKVPLFWRFARRRDWGREYSLGRAFHWRRDPRAADAHTGAAQIAERPCHVALSGFGKAKVMRESTKTMCHHGRTHL